MKGSHTFFLAQEAISPLGGAGQWCLLRREIINKVRVGKRAGLEKLFSAEQSEVSDGHWCLSAAGRSFLSLPAAGPVLRGLPAVPYVPAPSGDTAFAFPVSEGRARTKEVGHPDDIPTEVRTIPPLSPPRRRSAERGLFTLPTTVFIKIGSRTDFVSPSYDLSGSALWDSPPGLGVNSDAPRGPGW